MDSDLERVWLMWTLCQTQLRYSFGGVAGLDYTACKVVFDARGEALDSFMLEGLRILEADMLIELAEERKDGADGKDSC